jgi:hypothetical protein
MLNKDGTHLMNRQRANFLSDAKMAAPMELNEGQ